MRSIKPRLVPEWLPAPLREEIMNYNAASSRLDRDAFDVAKAERDIRSALTDGNGDPAELAIQLTEIRIQRLQVETNRLHHITRSADFNPQVREAATSALGDATRRLEERRDELERGFDALGVKSRWRQGCINETLHADRMHVGTLRVPPDMAPHCDELEDARARVKAAM